jgi:hypothetical protein
MISMAALGGTYEAPRARQRLRRCLSGSGSNWVVFLIPTHIHIDLKLAGVEAMSRDVAANAKGR